MTRIAPLLCLTALLMTASCQSSRNDEAEINWLEGDWIVDRSRTTKVFIDETLAQMELKGDTLTEKATIAAAKSAAGATVAASLKLLDKVEFKFTEAEFSTSAGDFGGNGVKYTILERPARDQIKIREGAEGSIERIYHREGKLIWYEGNFVVGKAKIFLKRK